MSSAKKAIIIIVVITAAAAAAFFGFLAVEGRAVDSSNGKQIIIQVEQGSGAAQIAATLKENGLIRSTRAFMLQSKISGYNSKYCAGYYAFTRKMSQKSIMKDIVNGKTAGKTFRITDGQSLEKVAVQLNKQGICTKKEFFREVAKGSFDYKFMKYLPKGGTRLEGFLWPDTYTIPIKGGAHEAIDAMLTAFNRNVTDKYYTAAKKMDMNIYDIVTTASIIQREASKSGDMPKVASVIYNRLDKDMYLQMDSIVAYITGEERVIATYADIAADSDYNPYKNKGLPPGPICSPGKTALDAAISPADTKYIYFVTSPKLDGSLVFSETDKQFAKDKKAFEKAYKKYQEKNGGSND